MSVHALIGRRVIYDPSEAECRVLAAELVKDDDDDPAWYFLVEALGGVLFGDYAYRFKMKRSSVKRPSVKRAQKPAPMVLNEDDEA